MSELMERISNIGVVPVVVINDPKHAVPACEALYKGGIDVAEVTFRTAAAEESIRLISEACPDMLVGAGTVTKIEQVDRAMAAGAKFIVTPGFNPNVVNYCVSHDIPIVPGCMDTNAIEMAIEAGLDTVKFFPAEQAGGLKMMKALAGPYTTLKFMPTGGINMDNMNEYLAFKKIICVGGSWMIKADMIDKEQFDKIEEISRETIKKMLDLRVEKLDPETNTITLKTSSLKRFNYHMTKQGLNLTSGFGGCEVIVTE